MCVASVEALGVSEALGITFEEVDRAGVVTLSRPARLNALNREMFEALSAQYREWAPNPQIYGVVMQSAHPSVFSSGGDLKVLQEWNEQGAQGAIRRVLSRGLHPCLGAREVHQAERASDQRPRARRRHRHQPLRHALRGGGGLSPRHAASGYRLSSRYRRHLFPVAHAGLDRALSCLDRAHHRSRRGLPSSPRQPLRARRAFQRDQGCASRQPSDRPAARWFASRPRRGRTRAAYAADRPRLLAGLGRGDPTSARFRAGRGRGLRARDRGARFARSRRLRSKSPSVNSSAASP